jgi:quercetin dioxygenase-like cupin family protein
MDESAAALVPENQAEGARSLIVLQTADVRVVEYVLAPGARLGWHRHSEITDRFYCLSGTVRVDMRDPPETRVLAPGESCLVPVGRVHAAVNADGGVSSYLLVQGVGRYDFIAA